MQKLGARLREASREVATGALRAIYPPQCITCDAFVEREGGLCPSCWPQVPFIHGLCCDSCGLPLPGEAEAGPVICDECLTLARPWEQGRAVMLYDAKAQQILLGLKYQDRLEHARPAGEWLARAARPLLQPDMLVAPVPLHWLRFVKRRYNQAALLSDVMARELELSHCPDLLVRTRHTGTQDGRGRAGRFANLANAFAPHLRRRHLLMNRHILLVDDVMTAGATFAAASEACLAAGAASVRVIALARVARRH
ncbi:MAG: ComF family protein [Rhodobacteraceae bacterium]|nr:MAG: ComF family protein [Paracoccaceae bacterium]